MQCFETFHNHCTFASFDTAKVSDSIQCLAWQQKLSRFGWR